jgi:uncharacterized membrane protein YbhN (UPF0104 family)
VRAPAPPLPRPQARGGRPWLRWVGVVVSVLSLGAVVVWALGQEPPELPTTGPRLAALGGAIALYLVACAVRGERWRALLRHNGARPARVDAWSLVAVGYMGNNVLPARAGDVLRVVFMAPRARTDARTVIGTLLAERLLDVVVLGLAFLALAYGLVGGAGVPSGEGLRVVLGGALALAALAAVAVVLLHRQGHLRRAWAFLAPVIAAVARLRGRHGAAMLALTLVVWGLEGGVWWAAGEAAGLELGAVEAAYLLALASMFALVPSGPGYAGTMDAAIVFGARVLGRGAGAALSYLLLLRFVLFVPITAVGLAALVVRYGGWSRLRAARSAAPA